MSTNGKENVTDQLVRGIFAATRATPPVEPVETARACLLDTLAVAIAGNGQALAEILEGTIEIFQGAPQATLWTRRQKASLPDAALFNGALAHALDFDDMHIESSMHPSAPVFAAALATGQYVNADGKALLLAATLGIETELRIGIAVNPSHYHRGWHATGTLGHFGAAVAAGLLLELSEEQMCAALGIAGTQASGLKATFGSMTKPLHAGIAARNGVMAALLASRGFTSAADILGATHGFGDALADTPDWSGVIRRWTNQQPWAICEILYKIHASSFCTQALIEAVLTLRNQHGLHPDQVQAMRGEVSRNSMENARINEPRTGMEAKFSLPHAMAQALAYGHARVADFTNARVNEPGTQRLRALTSVRQGAGLAWPEAIAHIELKDGRTLSQHIDLRMASSSAQDKWRITEAKFRDITSSVISAPLQSQIIDAVRDLDTSSSIAALQHLVGEQVHKETQS